MKTFLNGSYVALLGDRAEDFSARVIAAGAMPRDQSGFIWLDSCHPRELYETVGNIAVITVAGYLIDDLPFHGCSWITGYNAIRLAVSYALMDDAVEAIVLLIDSPGGLVTGCFELCAFLRSVREEKHLMAITKGMAASAAYAIASSAEFITAPQTGAVGSIGVYRMHVDYSAALEQEGVKVTLIESDDPKTEGNPYEPLGPEVLKKWTEIVVSVRELFVNEVAAGRGISADVVRETRAELFDGPPNIARAKEIGLIDQVMAPDAAFAALMEAVS